MKDARELGDELQFRFTGKNHNEKLNWSPKTLVAVDPFSKRPSAKIYMNADTKTLKKILTSQFNIHGLWKTMRTDPIFRSQDLKVFCTLSGLKLITRLTYIQLASRLIERSIQTFKGLLLAHSEDGHYIEENVSRALWVMRYTTDTTRKRTLFEKHYNWKPWTVLTNTFKMQPSLLSKWDRFRGSENPIKVPFYFMRAEMEI